MARAVVMRTHEGRSLHIECHDSLPSVHNFARSCARLGYPDGYVIFSEEQTAANSLGETLKKQKKERGIYISCILRPSISPSQAGFLGPLSAVACVNALQEQTKAKIGIGWISDIFCNGKKIGKIMMEGKLKDAYSYEYIIVSFTLKTSEDDFPPRLPDLVKKVFERDNTSISLIVAKNILSKFFSLFTQKIKTPEKFMDIYSRNFVLRGIKTTCTHDGKKQNCKILNVDKTNCSLIVEGRGGAIIEILNPRNIFVPNRIKTKRKIIKQQATDSEEKRAAP